MSKLTTKKTEPEIDKMTQKKTGSMTTKVNEMESTISPLVKQLQKIKKVKVQ